MIKCLPDTVNDSLVETMTPVVKHGFRREQFLLSPSSPCQVFVDTPASLEAQLVEPDERFWIVG